MDILTVAIIIRGIIFKVTDIEAIAPFSLINYEYCTEGDPIHNSVLLVADSVDKCFYFKSYDLEADKVVLTYEPLLADDLNQILSKCTVAGVN